MFLLNGQMWKMKLWLKMKKDVTDFIKNIADVMNRQEGDKLPVSAFAGREDGTFPQGVAAYEKREHSHKRTRMAA